MGVCRVSHFQYCVRKTTRADRDPWQRDWIYIPEYRCNEANLSIVEFIADECQNSEITLDGYFKRNHSHGPTNQATSPGYRRAIIVKIPNEVIFGVLTNVWADNGRVVVCQCLTTPWEINNVKQRWAVKIFAQSSSILTSRQSVSIICLQVFSMAVMTTLFTLSEPTRPLTSGS